MSAGGSSVKTALGRRKLPKFRTKTAEIRFWESNSLAPYVKDLEAVDEVLALSPGLEGRIRERMRKRLVALRLEEWQISRAKAIARTKGVPYQRLLREWIARGIQVDGKSPKGRRRAE
jgi:hypothetical protein